MKVISNACILFFQVVFQLAHLLVIIIVSDVARNGRVSKYKYSLVPNVTHVWFIWDFVCYIRHQTVPTK